MSNTEQIQNVKKALDLSNAISAKNTEYTKLKRKSFKAFPDEPKRTVYKSVYPEIKSTIKFNWIAFLLPTIVFIPWPIIYYFYIYKKNKEADIERIKNSTEYQNQCKLIDQQTAENQKKSDEQYQIDKKNYDEVIVPQYKKEFHLWKEKWEQDKANLLEEIDYLKNQLNSLYEETKIIPLQYRGIDTLQYIYDIISTSDYSIKEAIEIFDRNEQRKVDEARLIEQQNANRLADEQNQLAYEQNELLYEQNNIAERARKEANSAAVASAIQRHNTNKALNKIAKK